MPLLKAVLIRHYHLLLRITYQYHITVHDFGRRVRLLRQLALRKVAAPALPDSHDRQVLFFKLVGAPRKVAARWQVIQGLLHEFLRLNLMHILVLRGVNLLQILALVQLAR